MHDFIIVFIILHFNIITLWADDNARHLAWWSAMKYNLIATTIASIILFRIVFVVDSSTFDFGPRGRRRPPISSQEANKPFRHEWAEDCGNSAWCYGNAGKGIKNIGTFTLRFLIKPTGPASRAISFCPGLLTGLATPAVCLRSSHAPPTHIIRSCTHRLRIVLGTDQRKHYLKIRQRTCPDITIPYVSCSARNNVEEFLK